MGEAEVASSLVRFVSPERRHLLKLAFFLDCEKLSVCCLQKGGQKFNLLPAQRMASSSRSCTA